jgi:two-component sensor histidine kinase
VKTPAELAAWNTDLSGDAFAYLQRLMGSWGALSDLSFSDLLLLVPPRRFRHSDGQLIVIGQIRPTTGATLLRADLVGHVLAAVDWPGVDETLRTGKISLSTISMTDVLPAPVTADSGHGGAEAGASEGGPHAGTLGGSGPTSPRLQAELASREAPLTGEVPAIGERAQLECLPVTYQGSVTAVVARVGLLAKRRTGRLERVYGDLYRRLAAMVAAGEFPHVGEEVMTEDAPRVGDGLVVTDVEGRITYASPNAMSALHRMGVSEVVDGHRLSDLGVEEQTVEAALATGLPVIEEVERRPDVVVLVHCTPLLDAGSVTGVMVLMRDVTDLRRLDRLLLSKDAAIREVHHRIKNNLQTISSLLRLQGRRLEEGEGRAALREAERRVRSIAVVHEILSRDPRDQVPFGEIVKALVRMIEDSLLSGQDIQISVSGEPGDLSADMATPLAVVLAELLQNAVEHAFSDTVDESGRAVEVPEDEEIVGGQVLIWMDNDGRRLKLQVRDNGRGVPVGFDIDRTTSLGLSIVRDLVRSQLEGNIAMQSARGTVVTIDIPLVRSSNLPGIPNL